MQDLAYQTDLTPAPTSRAYKAYESLSATEAAPTENLGGRQTPRRSPLKAGHQRADLVTKRQAFELHKIEPDGEEAHRALDQILPSETKPEGFRTSRTT